MTRSIYGPMIAHAALVFVVWIIMYLRRVGEIRRRGIDLSKLSNSRHGAGVLEDVVASDNFRNQFEIPVLFFTICLCMAQAGLVSQLQLVLAWLFVGFRVLHSIIHITYNRVIHRFYAYFAGSLCVFTMWAVFACDLIFGDSR